MMIGQLMVVPTRVWMKMSKSTLVLDIFSNHQRHHHHKHRHQQHHHYHHLDEDVKVSLRRGGGVAHGDPHVVETGEVLE